MLNLLASVDIADALRWINTGGVVTMLVLILFGGYKKWWIFGWQYTDSEARCTKLEQERDGWREMALHGTNLAEQTVDLFKKQQR